jgi:DNA polymerase sigma
MMVAMMNSASAGLKLLMQPKDATSLGLLVTAVVFAVIPLDISQLMFAIAGAVGFSFVQIWQNKVRAKTQPRKKIVHEFAARPVCQQPRKFQGTVARSQNRGAVTTPSQFSRHQFGRSACQPEIRKPSNVPIVAPNLQGEDWDSQIEEMLVLIAPTIDDDKVVAKLAQRIQLAIKPMIPEVEVVGFASGSVGRNKAFGVAIPEVDIVAHISPSVLMRSHPRNSDARKLRKSAIRACTERLVSTGGFKFRRSAFRGDEPKVTLLAPASFELAQDAIPIDFSVNAATPLQNAALITECGQIDSRARGLILMVKRWAKDRGICHAAKGHLSPYTWGILSIFFLQVSNGTEPLLPKLGEFKMASGLMNKSATDIPERTWKPPTNCNKSVGILFKEFLDFYNSQFDWATEGVSVRYGCRQQPGTNLPLHVIVHESQKTEVGPSIEDPFDEAKNLGSGMHATSFARLKEELARACSLIAKRAPLVELLEPWAPPETPEPAEMVDEE